MMILLIVMRAIHVMNLVKCYQRNVRLIPAIFILLSLYFLSARQNKSTGIGRRQFKCDFHMRSINPEGTERHLKKKKSKSR